jgi:hypothetical protein
MARWQKWTNKREEEFLAWLKEGHTVSYACQQVGSALSTVYKHRINDPDFAKRWEEAREMGADRLEDVAIERAIAGSDRLLEFLLKGAKPEKYKDRLTTEQTGDITIRVVYDNTDN